MAKDFGPAERHILGLFSPRSSFTYESRNYTVIMADKPTCSKGEPKTDIYVLAVSRGVQKEFKISFKKSNADFLENKTSDERAKLLFGPDWSDIICDSTMQLRKEFEKRPLIYKQKHGKTDAGAITLGWKFELLRVKSGKLSKEMLLSKNQVIDAYAGTNLPVSKKDASVNNQIVPNSGVANFILFESENRTPRTIQEAVDDLITVEDYVNQHPDIFFACKALNYRSFNDEYDGDRPLAVYVDWSANSRGQLVSSLIFDRPLAHGGDYAYKKLAKALKQIGVTTAADLSQANVENASIIWNG